MSSVRKIAIILGSLFLGFNIIGNRNLFSSDSGYKFFKNYNYKEYEHSPQNWGITQAKNGIIYVANQGGVLEFDGESWRAIYEDIPNLTVSSLAVDAGGTVYIGGKGEIGYLQADEIGSLKYVSLLDHLDDSHKTFSNVWKTYVSNQGIYFQTAKFLFRWKNGKIKVWQPEERFYLTFMCAGKLFIRQKHVGLAEMIDDSLNLVPDGELFKTGKIYMMAPYDPGRILIGTDQKGFYIYDGTKVMPFPTKVDDYLKKNGLSHGIRLSSGEFALASRRGGVAIMDSHGHLKHIFDKNYGIQDNSVYHVFEDRQQNLWLGLSNGISKIEYGSPVSIYDERTNLSGSVMAIVKHNNKLYVGTMNGLYYLESPLKFRILAGIKSPCWDLLSIDDSILAATSNGVIRIQGDIKQNIINERAYVLLPSKHTPTLTWCGTNRGLIALSQANNRWTKKHRYQSIDQEIRHIAEEKDGSLWLTTSTGGVLKVDFPDEITFPKIAWYETSHGLPGGRVYAGPAAGHVMFATDKGIYRFDEKQDRFIPDHTLGNQFAAGGNDPKPVFLITEDNHQNIWFHSKSKNYRAVPGKSGSFDIYFKPFLRLPNIQVNTIYPDPDGKTIWFGTIEGLSRFYTMKRKSCDFPFHTQIRKVWVNGRLVFAGHKNEEKRKNSFTIIEYKDRNLRFEFASPFFEAEEETRYQCLLEGYDEEWSPWNKETWKDYTNIDSGKNTFRVRAKNIYGTLSGEGVFRFKVLPPWYKTWWAIFLYVSFAFGGVYFIVKLRSWKLVKEKQRLETIVEQRTVEINEKNQKLEQQTLQLREQSEKLEEMNRIKSRFFANISHEFRTPLTLIMSPLEQMLSDSRDKDRENTLNMMLRNSQRLLTLINQLLDLSRYDSGKMKLQVSIGNIVPFLKGALASFHMLAGKNELTLEFQTEKEDIPVYFDAQKLEEAINNLLINAIKFTPPGGKITVSVSLDKRAASGDENQPKEEAPAPQDFIIISVQDTGAGIPKEQLAHIFDRFYQAESHKEKALKGTGIGLAITKEIVLLHHGKIDVHSREGKGTEFVIQLPSGHSHLQQDEIVSAPETEPGITKDKQAQSLNIDDLEEETGDIDDAGDNAKETATAVGQPPGETGSAQEKNVILVVEDHPDMRKHIKDILKPYYTVMEAGNGKEGMKKAIEIIPDLIVSDIMMPEMDGNELCLKLKKDIKTSHVPVLLLTAKASEKSIIEGLETGADDYVTKPFNAKILLTRIKNLIDLRSHLQQKIQKQMLLQPAEISVSSMDREFIEGLHTVIGKNLSDPEFHVEQLSKKLYMERTTLYRKIKALTGETPTEYIRSYRLSRAAQLLRDGFGTVSQVSLEVGIANVAYFAKCFKEKYHQLPSTYLTSEPR